MKKYRLIVDIETSDEFQFTDPHIFLSSLTRQVCREVLLEQHRQGLASVPIEDQHPSIQILMGQYQINLDGANALCTNCHDGNYQVGWVCGIDDFEKKYQDIEFTKATGAAQFVWDHVMPDGTEGAVFEVITPEGVLEMVDVT